MLYGAECAVAKEAHGPPFSAVAVAGQQDKANHEAEG